jgi:cytochrome P450
MALTSLTDSQREEFALRLVEPASYSRRGYPYAEWAALRAEPGLPRFEPPGWPAFRAVTRRADIRAISKQPELFANAPTMVINELAIERQREANGFVQMETVINMDPPKHRKFRAVASPWFTPRALSRLDEVVRGTARRVIDELGAEGECDFIARVASLYPLKIIARILGVPESDEPFILRLTNELFGSEDPEFRRSADRAEHTRSLFMEFYQYFDRVMAERRASPREDLASVIANARIDGQPMGPIETMGYCLITFTAGHETTRGALGGGLAALIAHPAERERWAKDPRMTPLAIDEIMRFVTPVNTMARSVTRDVEICGQRLVRGERLVLFYASANRDAEVFDAPGTLRLDRDPNPHLAFGIGEHFCMGAHLARMTSGTLFRELLSRLESLEQTGPEERVASNLVPGIKHLPIRYQIRRARE